MKPNLTKTMKTEELIAILENHKKWLNGENGGIRADLSGARLSGADLSRVDLSVARLSGADLSGATLVDPSGNQVIIKKAMGWNGLYKYWAFAAITNGGIFICMGCHWRSIEDWEANFWNNPKEFPNDGSAASNMRLAAYNFAKEWIKNNS